ncbi:MAG: translation initiation factor IF-2 N-terminal domain-containing protein, partial [Nitrospirota bacterium]
MTKIRIYELAKQLGVPNKVILSELAALGVDGKTHSSSIETELARRITDILRKRSAHAAKAPKKEKGKAEPAVRAALPEEPKETVPPPAEEKAEARPEEPGAPVVKPAG